MKYIYLLFGIICLFFSIFFFIERSDIFSDIFKRGFNKTNKADLYLPTFISLIGLFFLYIYYKQLKTTRK